MGVASRKPSNWDEVVAEICIILFRLELSLVVIVYRCLAPETKKEGSCTSMPQV